MMLDPKLNERNYRVGLTQYSICYLQSTGVTNYSGTAAKLNKHLK